MAATGSPRQAQMSVDLGGEQVVLERVSSFEPLGQQFRTTVDIIASLGEVDLLPHLGKPIAVHIYEEDRLMRHFHGVISEAEFMRESPAGFHYRLMTRPFTYFLSTNRHMAIFQDLSVPKIISKIFDDAGITNYELKLSKSYPSRDYCVQYRESDFTFITRLMEEEGIYYFFTHAADHHAMILCDMPRAHLPASPASIHFNPATTLLVASGSSATSGDGYYLEHMIERVSTQGEQQVTLRAFDFQKPDRPLQGQANATKQHPNDTREVYDYPAGFIDEARGAALSTVRLAALRRKRQVYAGKSRATSLMVGTKVTVTGHPTKRFNRTYLIAGTHHSIANETYFAGAHEEDPEGNFVAFDMIPDDTPFHLPLETPRPVVQGLETAIISGPAGEEIYTDEYGRVKVRFHWDRSDTPGERSTCWVRVAQFGGLGTLILPRVNQEVMVDFLQGDPDKPIVMGWVFNKSHMPQYDLPANKTKALWRTKRYGDTGQYPNAKALDTGAPGVNELRFEDKGGSEEVFLHAERDMNTRVRFAETHHVGQNQTLNIGYDRKDDVGNDEVTTIGKDQTLTVTGDQKETLKAKRTIDVTSTDELTVGQSLTIKVGTDLKISAGQSITLTCGGSSIEIKPGEISIKGPQVTFEGIATAKVTSPMTTLAGTGINTITGGIVKIN